jgi:hypothetical protein
MVKITKLESTQYYIALTFDNGVSLSLCPHEDYIYISLGGIEVPTSINGNPEWKSNNTLSWGYKKAGYK